MKTYKPTSKSRRGMTNVTYRGVLTKSTPEKSLTHGFKRSFGRDANGRIAMRHRGGGHKRLYREIDFLYNKKEIPAKITSVEYDPNRSGFIALASYADGAKRYVLVPQSMKVGDTFIVGEKVDLEVGNRLALKNIPVGTFVFNVELKLRAGAKLVRSAGTYAQVVAHDNGFTSIKLPSTEIRKVVDTCYASIGEVSNEEYRLRNLGKAGRSRHLGRRPSVRGMAMNPVDHPYGGGEGRQGRGRRRAITFYGKPTGKGQKSRRSKKYSNKFIVQKRKRGKVKGKK